MDVPVSAAIGGMRVALQVATAFRHPVLEVYANLRHTIGPEEDLGPMRTFNKEVAPSSRVRRSDVFVDFIVVNIGGVRAEDVQLSLRGDFTKRHKKKLSSLAIFSGEPIAQMAPGQVLPLFRLDHDDLFPERADEVPGDSQEFTVEIRYSGPSAGLNWPLRKAHAVFKARQYRNVFTFSPKYLRGLDVPAPEYT